jgi:hypothetical protein
MAVLTKDGADTTLSANVDDSTGTVSNYTSNDSHTYLTNRTAGGGYKSFTGNYFQSDAPVGGSSESWGIIN